MITLYAATSNAGKLRDFAAAASQETGASILPLPLLETIPAPPENEPTFEGNARAKAVYYSRFLPGEIVLADDSGLEVDSLEGEPGVRSARYASDAGFIGSPATTTDQRNNLYLLTRLRGVSAGRRGGRYRCVLAAARDGKCLADSRRQCGRRNPFRSPRQRRVWLRSALLSFGNRQDHGRDRSRHKARFEPSGAGAGRPVGSDERAPVVTPPTPPVSALICNPFITFRLRMAVCNPFILCEESVSHCRDLVYRHERS